MKSKIEKYLKNIDPATKDYLERAYHIAEILEQYRRKENLSQKELADKFNKSESEISKWLGGVQNFTLKTISSIEQVIGQKIFYWSSDHSQAEGFICYPGEHPKNDYVTVSPVGVETETPVQFNSEINALISKSTKLTVLIPSGNIW